MPLVGRWRAVSGLVGGKDGGRSAKRPLSPAINGRTGTELEGQLRRVSYGVHKCKGTFQIQSRKVGDGCLLDWRWAGVCLGSQHSGKFSAKPHRADTPSPRVWVILIAN